MPEAYNLNEDSSLYLQGPLSEEEAERIYNAVIAIDNSQLKSEIKKALIETNPLFREGCLNLAQHVGDQITRLNNSVVPIAIIHAENDLAIQLPYLKKLQIKNLWEQKIQVIPDCGHFMIWEKPAELAAILDRFLSIN
jgi:pimeloyl-ACP methyl ester carboxylesterase